MSSTATTSTTSSTLSTSFKSIASLEPIYIGGNVPYIRDSKGNTLLLLRKSINTFTLTSPESGKVFSTFTATATEGGGEEEDEDPFFGFCLKDQNTMFTINHKGLFERWTSSVVADDVSTASNEENSTTKTWKAHASPISVLVHHPTQPWLATGSADHGVRVWDSEKGHCTHNFKGGSHGAPITSLAFLDDDDTLVSGAQDGSISIWSLRDSKVLNKWSNKLHSASITSFLFSEHCLVASGRDRIISVFSIERKMIKNMTTTSTTTITHKRSISTGESIESLAWSVEGQSFWAGGQFGKLREFSLTGEIMMNDDASPPSSPPPCLNSPIQHLFSCKGGSKTPTIITEDTLIRHGHAGKLVLVGNHGEITDSAISTETIANNTRKILHLASNSPEIRSYPLLADGSIGPMCTLTSSTTERVDSILSVSVLAHQGSTYMAIGSKNNKAILFKDGVELCSILHHTDSISVVLLFLRSGSMHLLTASSDLSIKLFRISDSKGNYHGGSKQHLWSIRAHEKDINTLLVRNNTVISGGQDKLIKIWSLDDGSLLKVLKGHKRGVWSLACPKAPLPLDHPFYHSILASSSSDNTIRLWNLDGSDGSGFDGGFDGDQSNNNKNNKNNKNINNSELIKTMEDRCVGGLLKICFIEGQRGGGNPSVLRLLSCSGDGLMKVWNPLKGVCESTFDGHEDRCWAMLAMSSEEQDRDRDDNRVVRVITSDSKGLTRVWLEDTQERQLNERHQKEVEIVGLQRLSNLERGSKWMEAIPLSLKLRQPFRLHRSLLLLTQQMGLGEAMAKVEEVVSVIIEDKEEISVLLGYCKEWNVSLKRSFIAQLIIQALLKSWKKAATAAADMMTSSSSSLTALTSSISSTIPARVKEDLRHILPYTEKHFAKIDELCIQSHIIDYVIQ